jgi:hypothetical protein
MNESLTAPPTTNTLFLSSGFRINKSLKTFNIKFQEVELNRFIYIVERKERDR